MKRKKLNTTEARGGTNSILTDSLTKQFCQEVEDGLPADGVCDFLGINPSTFWTWIRKGQKFIDGGTDPYSKGATQEAIYGRFVKEFRTATARYRRRVVREAHRFGSTAWIQAMTILERRDRKSFSRNEPAGGSDAEMDVDERFL